MSTRSGKWPEILGIVAVASLMATASASAATISFYTGDTFDTLVASVAPGAITNITPHSVWGNVNDDAGLPLGTAKWISYTNTGLGSNGLVATVAPNSANPDNDNVLDISEATAVFARSFTIGGPGDFNFWILADDTATVVLSGPEGATLFTAPPRNSQVHPCMGSVIGCLEKDMGIAHLTDLDAGNYTLTVYAFQTGSDVFGIQYAGDYTDGAGVEENDLAPVPEPASLVLVGSGLLGLARRARRGRKTQA